MIGWSRSQATTPIFSISIKSPAATSPEYRPDIDGLRAIAVLAVCFYHANFSGFSGGYVGVDVFFVVSGFLIASFISSEMERGTFSLISFYERRIRRIFPALFNLALWTILAAFILLNPDDLRDFGNSLLAMTMFASNLFFSGQDHLRGYFGDLASQKPLLHTWSLAVEEQFYIFFPITMLALHRWSAKRQTLSIVFIVIFAVSLILGVGSTASNAEAAFFFLTPRVWEFMCGALLATISLPPLKHRLLREIAGVVGLALVCYAVTVFDKHTTFPGLNALFPCVGAALLIHAGAGGTSYIKRLLSLPPLVFVGVISYSLYLWHWPILVFAKLFLVRGLDNWETAAAIACALLAAFLSFEFVELPFRRKRSSIGRQQVFALGGIAGIICIFVGGAFVETGGLPQRYDIKTREIVLKNLERKKDGFWQCESWRTEVHTMSDMNFCEFGHTESNNVMFWGDSFLGMLGSMIKEAKSTGDLPDSGVILAIEPGCPVIPNVNNTSEVGYHCDDFNKFALQRADADDIGAVFFVFSRWWVNTDDMCLSADGQCLRKLPKSAAPGYLLDGLRSMIQELRGRGRRVIVTLPFPVFDRSVPDVEIHNALFGAAFGKIALAEYPLDEMRNRLISLARDTGADIFDPRASLCDRLGCTYQIDGVSIYLGTDHIAASQAGILKANLIRTLSAQ